jgi:hypothetical protein
MKKHVDTCFKFICTCFKFSAIVGIHIEPKQWIHPLSQKLNDVHLKDFEFKDKKQTNRRSNSLQPGVSFFNFVS